METPQKLWPWSIRASEVVGSLSSTTTLVPLATGMSIHQKPQGPGMNGSRHCPIAKRATSKPSSPRLMTKATSLRQSEDPFSARVAVSRG